MSDPQRREFLAGTLAGALPAAAGDPSFMNNVPDPLLSGKDLPTFKLALVSVTLFGSHGRYRIEQLQQGDVGYVPQGYGHSIENVGGAPARILIGFNAGIDETIDLTQWIAARRMCSPPISASRLICSGNFPIATCSSQTAAARPNRAQVAPALKMARRRLT